MTIILTATGFKTSSKGRVANDATKAGIEFGKMSKSDARKARKMLHADGRIWLASARRAA